MNDHQRKMARKASQPCGYADGGGVRGRDEPGLYDKAVDTVSRNVVQKTGEYFLTEKGKATKRGEAAGHFEPQGAIERLRRHADAPGNTLSPVRGVSQTDRAEDEALKDADLTNKANGGWIDKAIKHPGREKRAAARAGMSTRAYMEKHRGDKGSAGAAARLGLRLEKMR